MDEGLIETTLVQETAPANSEEALALEFARRHADKLRYVAAWGKWLMWDGTCWSVDETRNVFSLARELCRETANALNKPALQKTIASAKTRAAVVSLAGEDRRLAATVEQWDSDPWLLNTPSGVVDLRTGRLRAHRPEDYITAITAVAPNDKCPCPLWNKFIARVTNNDDALASFLARMCGYGLTGVTNEHALFFLYGTGANGKGTFLNTVANILNNYHRVAPMETLTESITDRHPTELAGLRGKRIVTATETEEGRRWAEARIKQLTGGDKIAARFMRQDFFEYIPQFKLLIAGNHKPSLRSVDEAIKRRLNLIPFIVTIPKEERDLKLAEKLKAEWPGILAWMIAGCLAWEKAGLAPPTVVTQATEKYLAEEDVFKTWLDECCRKDPNEWTAFGILFGYWKDRAEAHGETVGTSKGFSGKLQDKGFEPDRKHKRGFSGLSIFQLDAPRERIWSAEGATL